jgi:hypothetical protein
VPSGKIIYQRCESDFSWGDGGGKNAHLHVEQVGVGKFAEARRWEQNFAANFQAGEMAIIKTTLCAKFRS